MDNFEKILAGLVGLKVIGNFKGGIKSGLSKTLEGAQAATPMMYAGHKLGKMEEELAGINETLKKFLLRNGETPHGVIEFDGIVTKNPISASPKGRLIKND